MSNQDIIFKSKYEDVDVPHVSVGEFMLDRISKFGNKPALIDSASGSTITFNALVLLIKQFAKGIQQYGFKQHEVFCIYSPNIIYFPVVFQGVLLAGGTVTTANPLYTAEELAHQLSDSKANYLITISMFVDKAKEAMKIAGLNPKHLFVFDSATDAISFSELLKHGNNPSIPHIDIHKDIAALPYSSGTTGLPKGVCLSHYNIVTNLLQITAAEGAAMSSEEILLGILPFFHIYGMIVILHFGLLMGCTVVVVAKFDLVPFLELIQKYKVTWAHLVPPIILALAKHPIVAKYNISTIKSIVSAAAPLGADVQQEFMDKLKIPIRQGYGMTELSPGSHMTPLTALRVGSCGTMLPNLEAKIVDTETGKSVGVGHAGELCIRGPSVMVGYLNNPKATANTIDKDGFLHTGDIATIDDDGYYYIVDRLKELIKYKGFQVAPAELEALLVTHPSVADAAVIGVPNEEAGELPKAYVVLKEGQKDVTHDVIAKWLESKVTNSKRLRGGVEFIDVIPKSASGKILRRVLKDMSLMKAKL
jgi:acyl-CoA synthetase (AMP-forming)/AMP-acid ligase II